MEHKDRLTRRLYHISTGAFYLTMLFFGYLIWCEFFPRKEFDVYPNHASGYTVPVRIQLNTSGKGDTIIHYKTSNGGGRTSNRYWDEDHKELYDRILNSPDHKKTYVIHDVEVNDYKSNDISSHFTDIDVFKAEGYVILNPKNIREKLVLAIYNYMAVLVTIFILWHVKSFFKNLTLNFSFNNLIANKLYVIGNAILCYQVFNWCITLLIKQFYMNASFDVSINGISDKMYSLHPMLDFNFGYAFMALGLIVLSKLLRYGYELQEENELTI